VRQKVSKMLPQQPDNTLNDAYYSPRAASQMDMSDALSALGHLTIAWILAQLFILTRTPTEKGDNECQNLLISDKVRSTILKVLSTARLGTKSSIEEAKVTNKKGKKTEESVDKLWQVCFQVWISFILDAARLSQSQDFDLDTAKDNQQYLFDSNPFGSDEVIDDSNMIGNNSFGLVNGPKMDTIIANGVNGNGVAEAKGSWMHEIRDRQLQLHLYLGSYGATGNLYSHSHAGPSANNLAALNNGNAGDENLSMDTLLSNFLANLEAMSANHRASLLSDAGYDLALFYARTSNTPTNMKIPTGAFSSKTFLPFSHLSNTNDGGGNTSPSRAITSSQVGNTLAFYSPYAQDPAFFGSSGHNIYHMHRQSLALRSLSRVHNLASCQQSSIIANISSRSDCWPNEEEERDAKRGGITYGLLQRPHILKASYNRCLPLFIRACAALILVESSTTINQQKNIKMNNNVTNNASTSMNMTSILMEKKSALFAILQSALEQQMAALMDSKPPLVFTFPHTDHQGLYIVNLGFRSNIGAFSSLLRALVDIAGSENWDNVDTIVENVNDLVMQWGNTLNQLVHKLLPLLLMHLKTYLISSCTAVESNIGISTINVDHVLEIMNLLIQLLKTLPQTIAIIETSNEADSDSAIDSTVVENEKAQPKKKKKKKKKKKELKQY
jgi:hypothetical protein